MFLSEKKNYIKTFSYIIVAFFLVSFLAGNVLAGAVTFSRDSIYSDYRVLAINPNLSKWNHRLYGSTFTAAKLCDVLTNGNKPIVVSVGKLGNFGGPCVGTKTLTYWDKSSSSWKVTGACTSDWRSFSFIQSLTCRERFASDISPLDSIPASRITSYPRSVYRYYNYGVPVSSYNKDLGASMETATKICESVSGGKYPFLIVFHSEGYYSCSDNDLYFWNGYSWEFDSNSCNGGSPEDSFILGDIWCAKPKCNSKSECNDGDAYTFDECNNPGTRSSYCSHTPINCIKNSDCGVTGYVGNNYCSSNDVFRNYRTSVCKNPATKSSYCSVSNTAKLIKDCGVDSCGNWGNTFCQSGDVYKSRDCNDRGCSSGSCFNNPFVDKKLVEECEDICENGECVDVTCFEDKDCGSDGFIGERYCQEGDVYQDYKEFTCSNPGTGNSECSSEVEAKLVSECEFGCDDGMCEDPRECQDGLDNDGDNLIDAFDPGCWADLEDPLSYTPLDDDESDGTIVCSEDKDCGSDGFIGERYCQEGDVYQDYEEFTCSNPGLGTSECSSDVEARLIEECEFECESGVCLGECCDDSDCSEDYYSSNYCDDGDVFRDLHDFSCVDEECVEEVIKELVEECEHVCHDGECHGECSVDEDCGEQTIELICDGDEVWEKIKTPECVDNLCEIDIDYEFVEECRRGCEDGKCRKRGGVPNPEEFLVSLGFNESIQTPSSVTGVTNYTFIEPIQEDSKIELVSTKAETDQVYQWWVIVLVVLIIIVLILILIVAALA